MTAEYETQVLVGRDIPDSHRKSMPGEDFAGKGRSFPIDEPEDVADAASSIGRAGDDNFPADTIKANIIRIAKRKGAAFIAKLPDAWNSGKVAACEIHIAEKGQRLVAAITGDASGPVRIPIAKLGKWVKGKLTFSITKTTLSSVVANLRKRRAETVIDYEHASEFPEMAQGQPVPAAGWIKSIEDTPDDDGVLYAHAEFTPRAQQMIQSGEYKYLSPVIDWGARDKVTGEAQGATLTSVALTNRPFLESMPALALSDRGWKEINRGDAVEDAAIQKGKVMKLILTDRVARTVRVVNDDNSETTLPLEGLEALPKVVRLSDVKRTKEGILDFAAIETGEGILVASEVFQAMTVQQELQAAITAGKITPAQRPHFEKLALSDLAGFRAIVDSMVPQVDLTEKGIGGGDKLAASDLKQVEGALFAAVAEKQKLNPQLQYHEALKLVASERPDLNKRYTQLTRGAAVGGEE